jgi:hypothetical protein
MPAPKLAAGRGHERAFVPNFELPPAPKLAAGRGAGIRLGGDSGGEV